MEMWISHGLSHDWSEQSNIHLPISTACSDDANLHWAYP
jgi:hypothetical protein